MTRPGKLAIFALGVALVPLSAARAEPPTGGLREIVEPRDTDAARAAALADRARAGGKADEAATAGRVVVQFCEAQLKAVRDQAASGRLCSAEPLEEAEGRLAVARAWLADLEGRRADLLTELPKVVTYYESRVRVYETLRKLRAIGEAEADAGLKEFGGKVRRARAWLAEVRGRAAGAGSTAPDWTLPGHTAG